MIGYSPSSPGGLPTSDEERMRRVQDGDRGEFEVLYNKYHPAVLGYLRRTLGHLDLNQVGSLGQEAFLRAFRFKHTYRFPQRFSTWIFTIARNLAINSRRRKKRSGD